MKILLWLYKSRMKNGLAPLWIRVTINGQREQFSSGVRIRPERWNAERQCVKGRDEESQALNKTLQSLKTKLQELYADLLLKEDVVTSHRLKYAFQNRDEPGKKLLEVFRLHNERIKALVGKEYSEETYLIYERTERQVADFIRYKYPLLL